MHRLPTLLGALLLAATVLAQDQVHNLYGGSTTGAYGKAVAFVPKAPNSIFGIDVVVIGAPEDDTAGTDAGRAEIRTTGGVLIAELLGPSAGARFGWAVSGLGDVTGDEIGEVAVGAPGDDTQGTDAGAVHIYNGNTGALVHTLYGAQAGEQFGHALAWLEDINADGKADLAVGSPYYDPAGLTNAGRVRAYSSSTWFVLESFTGLATGDSVGWSVAEAGDLDFDGITDILTGAPWADVGGSANAGKAYVFSGLTGAILRTLSGTGANSHFGWSVSGSLVPNLVGSSAAVTLLVGSPDADGSGADEGRVDAFHPSGTLQWTLTGPMTNARFGASLAPAGLDYIWNQFSLSWTPGDPEVAIGAPGAIAPGPFIGGGMVRVVNAQFGTTKRTWYGSSANSGFGESIAFVRTVESGFPTLPTKYNVLAVGAPGGGTTWTPGRVVFGPETASESTIFGKKVGVGYGAAVSSIGDVNGDGRADFALGAPNDDGTVSGAGMARIRNGANGNLLVAKGGGQTGANYAAALAPAGDVNHDGIPDLIVGAPQHDTLSLFNEGAAFVVSGSSGATLKSYFGTSSQDHFGGAVAGGGDVDADGRDDYAVAAPDRNAIATDVGQVKVYSGATGLELESFLGTTGSEHLGQALVLAGDVNLDGYVDIAAGAPGAASGAGNVKIWSGKTGSVIRTLTSSGSLELGRALAVGDVNLDGFPDQIVGAHRKSSFSLVNQGAVLVYSGANGALLCSAQGDDTHDELGISVAFLGDVNKDGFGDFAAGAQNATAGGLATAGAVRVHSGFDGVKLHEILGNATGDAYGSALAGLGDADGDGLGDWIAGAPGNDLNGPDAGHAEVWSAAPEGISTYGIGTFGCLGPEVIWGNTTPEVNTPNFRISLTKAPANSLVLGIVADVWLQYGQDPFGLGVILHVDLFASGTVLTLDLPTDAAGRSQAALPIPNNPFLHGAQFYAQTVSAWPAAQCVPSPFGLSSSQGLKIVVP